MARGKAGPKPETKEEIEERKNDPTAEQIVGVENVVDVGSALEGMRESEDFTEAELQPAGYKCSLPGCPFTTTFLAEMEEHVNGTGHGGFKQAEPIVPPVVQPELFSTPGIVHRNVEVPMEPEFLAAKREKLADLYQQALDVKGKKKSADANFNAKLTEIDEQMQEIARVLKTPYTYENADCEWRIIEGENARGLYRLDTGEEIERQALSEEDRIKELDKAQRDNEAPLPEPPAEAPIETEEAPVI